MEVCFWCGVRAPKLYIMSSKGERQNTPSDNKKGQAQNANMKGSNNPKTSGNSFAETRKEANEGRETGLNESGKRNQPLRDSGRDDEGHIET
jgi:hypothetical protein